VPWEISLDALNLPPVQQAIENARRCERPPTHQDEESGLLFSEEVTRYVVGSCGGLAIGHPGLQPSRFAPKKGM
jgi:hypothetical protein